MSNCPHCDPRNNNINETLHNEESRIKFFATAQHVTCSVCFQKFTFSPSYFNDGNSSRRVSQETYDMHEDDYKEYYKYIKLASYTETEFAKLNQHFNPNFNTNKLVDYLPTDTMKQRYTDVKAIMELSNVSSEGKVAPLRPLLEAFINHHSGVKEDHQIRPALNKLSNAVVDDEMKKTLHKILSSTLHGVHIKMETLYNKPEDMLLILETLFTKLYKLPAEKEKLKQEFEDKKSALQKELDELIALINDPEDVF